MVNLSVDGEVAKGRWYGFFLLSDNRGNASIRVACLKTNTCAKTASGSGVHRFYPQYDGPYETGWHNWKGQDVGVARLDVDGAGQPC